ncbi:hypothetical protein B5G12_13075 [Faecalibacterium sp. An58]|uniref:AAA family ATPase n=1 Tax=Faecalibacterium sp. An58 TaxID=1965648 RepID=UPI000B39F1D8|nr:AAA family ATPase [Faecalibacterium sp. An58]OUN68114.1 hypothetical protein B5G12_13075 [Faecalibacterium sp. An58]
MKRKEDGIALKATVIAIVNQKGGAGKTMTSEDLDVGIAMEDKNILWVNVAPRCFDHIHACASGISG